MERVQAALEGFKNDIRLKLLEQDKGPFKHLLRSKGFIWLSNHPSSFFEWSQAANNITVEGAYPWAEAV